MTFRGPSSFVFIPNENFANEFNNDQEVRAELERLAQLAVEYAQNLSAVESGAMRDSVRFVGFQEVEGQLAAVIEVGDGAEYWVYVEYGTGVRGAASEQPDPGLPVGYAHGSVAGVPARPFMRPTINYLRNRVGE